MHGFIVALATSNEYELSLMIRTQLYILTLKICAFYKSIFLIWIGVCFGFFDRLFV